MVSRLMRDLKIVFSILLFFMSVSQCFEYDVHGSLYQYFTLNFYQQQSPTTIHVDVRPHYVSYPHFTQKAAIAAIKTIKQLRQQQESAVTLPTSVVMPLQQKLIPSDVKIISSLPEAVVEIDAVVELEHSVESAKYDALAVEQIENQLYEYDQSHRWCNSEAIIGLRQDVFNKVKSSNQIGERCSWNED